MPSLHRLIITIDMLNEELAEHCQPKRPQAHEYLVMLKELTSQLNQLLTLLAGCNDKEISEITRRSECCRAIKSRKLLQIHIKLLQYIHQYYQAHDRAQREAEKAYDLEADNRMTLFQTHAIKAKSQFRTVTLALGKTEYQRFLSSYALPRQDWQWQQLHKQN